MIWSLFRCDYVVHLRQAAMELVCLYGQNRKTAVVYVLFTFVPRNVMCRADRIFCMLRKKSCLRACEREIPVSCVLKAQPNVAFPVLAD